MIKRKWTSDWMGNLDKNKKLTDLRLPATHDSAADQLHIELTPECERTPSFNKLIKATNSFPCLTIFAERWALTQKKSVFSQLEKGIRCFDFRVAYDGMSICLTHSFYLENFETVLKDINAFMEAHPAEIIILRISPDHEHVNKTQPYHEICYQLIAHHLGHLLIKHESAEERLNQEQYSLNNLLRKNQRILLIYEECNSRPEVWRKYNLLSHWANKPSADEVFEDIKTNPTSSRINQRYLKECSAVVTPNSSSIRAETFKLIASFGIYKKNYGIKKEAKKVNDLILNFLEANPDYVKANNIFSMDFPSKNDIKRIIRTNKM